METKAHHVIVGLFTLFGLGFALAFGIWLVKSGEQEETERYQVVFQEAVTGLSVGSLVQYNGLRVGEVRDLRLDPKDPRRVLADIEVALSTPINQGTRARMAIANITGAANILLSSDIPTAPALESDGIQPPVIIADPSPIGALLGNSEVLLSGITELVNQGAALLSPDNVERFGSILLHLEQVSGALAESRNGVGESLASLNATLEEARGAMQDARRLLAGGNAMLETEGQPMLASGRRAMRSLEQSSAQLAQLLRRHEQSLDQGLGGVGEITPVIQELYRALATLNRILQRLEDDPGGYLRGRSEVREFEP